MSLKQESEKEFITELKQNISDYTNELVNNDINHTFFLFLIVIENIQIIGYHQNQNLSYSSVGWSQMKELTQYLNPIPLYTLTNINSWAVPITSVISAAHIFMIFYGYKIYRKKSQKIRKSTDQRNFQKPRIQFLINLLIIMFNTVLTIPVFVTSASSIYCTPPFSKQSCFSGSNILLFVLGLFNLFWLLACNIYFALFYYSQNPFTSSILAASSNYWSLGKLLIKVFPMTYILTDPLLAYPAVFVGGIFALYGLYLITFRIVFPFYRYDFVADCRIIFIEGFTVVFLLFFILLWVFSLNQPTNNIVFILSFPISCFAGLVIMLVYKFRKEKLLQKINSLDKEQIGQVLEYLIYLMNTTQKNFKKTKVFEISHIQKLYVEENWKIKEEEFKMQPYFRQEKYYQNINTFYQVIIVIIDRVIDKNKTAYSFYLLQAYILNEKLNSKIKAVTTLSKVMNEKLTFSEEYLIKGLIFDINMHYYDARDMEIYRKFNEYLIQQEEESLQLADYYSNYWTQLIHQRSSLPKLYDLIIKIKIYKQKLAETVSEALKIFPSHVRVLHLYKMIMKQIVNDYQAYIKYQAEYQEGLKLNEETNIDAYNTIQFKPNENLLVLNIVLSENRNNIGNFKIDNISSNVQEFLGFKNFQLKNQELNRVIPRIYHSSHDAYIERMLDNSDSDIESREIRIFPLNSEGNILECNVISKFMPSIKNGITVVSFIQQCDKHRDQFFIIYDSETGIVDSMNSEAEMMLKDGKNTKKNDLLTIPDHINDLLPGWNYRQQKWEEESKSMTLKNIANESQYTVKKIQVIRSDNLKNTTAKVLRFKGDYYNKMISLESMGGLKECQPIKQFFDFKIIETQKKTKKQNFVTELQIQGDTMKQIQTQQHFSSQEEKKKQQLVLKDKVPPRNKFTFIIIQWLIFVLVIGLNSYQITVISSLQKCFKDDSLYLIKISKLQSDISESTFIMNQMIVARAHESNHSQVTLKYPSFNSSLNILGEVGEVEQIIELLGTHIKQVDEILIKMIKNQQISKSSVTINITYLKNPQTKELYYTQMSLISASYQFELFINQVTKNLEAMDKPMKDIILSPEYYFISYNTFQAFTTTFKNFKNEFIQNTKTKIDSFFVACFIIEIILFMFIVGSSIILLFYYNYVYQNFIKTIQDFYEKIPIEKIEKYQLKCLKFLKFFKADAVNPEEKTFTVLTTLRKTLNFGKEERLEQQKQNLKSSQTQPEEFLTFDNKPQIKNHFLMVSIFIVIVMSLCICQVYYFNKSTQNFKNDFQTMSDYTIVWNAFIQLRVNSYASINFLNFWSESEVVQINEEINFLFRQIYKYVNRHAVSLKKISVLSKSQVQQLQTLQKFVRINQTATIASNLKDIQWVIEEIDKTFVLMEKEILKSSQEIVRKSEENQLQLLVWVISIFIFIFCFWVFYILRMYQKLNKMHYIMKEMYLILGYNLLTEMGQIQNQQKK